MRAVRLLMLIALMLFTAAVNGSAQSPAREQAEGTAVITGRVTVNGKPAAGVVVTLLRIDPKRDEAMMGMFQREPLIKASTDNEGRYRLTGVQAARYRVAPFSPSHLSLMNEDYSGESRTVTTADGETLQDIDFALVRGGVITGRVTKADGRPVIGEPVSCSPVSGEKQLSPRDEEDDEEDEEDEEDNVSYRTAGFGGNQSKTDDRGIYRIYGLAPGRYVLSVGAEGRSFEVKRRAHPVTYYPGVTDKAKATVVEVALGGEVANADIKLGLPDLTFRVSGRVIDADTGKPLEKAIIMSGAITEVTGSVMSVGSNALSNEKGEFRLEGIQAGRHAAYASFGFDGQSEYYSDKAEFEIKGEDVTGLVIKARRGLVVSGTAILETTSDATAAAKLAQVDLIAYGAQNDGQAPAFSRSKINPDGSIHFRGLKPGKMQIMINSFTGEKRFHVTRIERGGVEQREALDIAPGDQITDLRVVLTYANSSIRGQLKIEGGALPKGMQLSAIAIRKSQTDRMSYFGRGPKSTYVDANGRFEFEEIIAGEYEVVVTADSDHGNRNAQPLPRVSQIVTVAPDAETTITLVLDLSRKEKER
jgi:protocatechuate 3,4-dioxygenase beta subunit